MKNNLIIGAKYFIKDLVLNNIFEIQITQLNDVELYYKNLNETIGDEYYRELEQIEIISIIDEIEAKRLNNNKIFSIHNDLIKAIISREEVKKYSENNFKDLEIDKNTVLISITDPNTLILSEQILKNFKDKLNIQFWDVEENSEIGKYEIISKEKANIIKEFILKNKKNNFVIHCEAGISRSAGVGLAVECLIKFNGNKDKYLKEYKSDILEHHRYYPNQTVFKLIVD